MLQKRICRHILYIAIVALCLLGIPCPILTFIGIECPTCGMTRALLALFRLDFKVYVEYQPFAIWMLIAVLLGVHLRIIPNKRMASTYIIITAVTNYIYYVLKF